VKNQQSLSTQMPPANRFGVGRSASWRLGGAIGVDGLFRVIYGLGEQGTEIEDDFSIGNHRPNLAGDPIKRSGRYRLRVTVPI